MRFSHVLLNVFLPEIFTEISGFVAASSFNEITVLELVFGRLATDTVKALQTELISWVRVILFSRISEPSTRNLAN